MSKIKRNTCIPMIISKYLFHMCECNSDTFRFMYTYLYLIKINNGTNAPEKSKCFIGYKNNYTRDDILAK